MKNNVFMGFYNFGKLKLFILHTSVSYNVQGTDTCIDDFY